MTTTTAKSIGKVHRKEFPKVYEYIKHGKTYYRIDCRAKNWKGKQVEQRQTKDAALSRAREIADLIQKNGIKGMDYDLEIQEFRNTKARLLPFGRTVHEVVEEWISLCSANCVNSGSRTRGLQSVY